MADDIFTYPIVHHAFRFVETELGVGRTDLIGPCRKPPLVRARALFVAIMKLHSTFSYPEIGRLLGGRDHTTIMHLAKVIGPRLHERDAAFVALCDRFNPKEPSTCTH